MKLEPLGYQQLTSLATINQLTVPKGTTLVYLQAEVQNIRYVDDTTKTPTTSVGMLLIAGNDPSLYEGNFVKLRFIEAAAGGILNVSYYAAKGDTQ